MEESDVKRLIEKEIEGVHELLLLELQGELSSLREALREVQEVVSKLKGEAPMRVFHHYP